MQEQCCSTKCCSVVWQKTESLSPVLASNKLLNSLIQLDVLACFSGKSVSGCESPLIITWWRDLFCLLEYWRGNDGEKDKLEDRRKLKVTKSAKRHRRMIGHLKWSELHWASCWGGGRGQHWSCKCLHEYLPKNMKNVYETQDSKLCGPLTFAQNPLFFVQLFSTCMEIRAQCRPTKLAHVKLNLEIL